LRAYSSSRSRVSPNVRHTRWLHTAQSSKRVIVVNARPDQVRQLTMLGTAQSA